MDEKKQFIKVCQGCGWDFYTKKPHDVICKYCKKERRLNHRVYEWYEEEQIDHTPVKVLHTEKGRLVGSGN